MALKAKITKEQFAKLPADIQAEYVEDGDSYKLDVDGLEDTGALRRAKDRESTGRKEAEAKVRELEERLERIEGDDARKTGDIEKLEKGWQKKLDDANLIAQGRIDKLTAHTTKSLVDNVALSVATKISNSPQLLIPHIRARLQANFDGDEPVTVVLGKDGKPSTMTVDELSAEFVANKDFSAIIVGSKASGGASKPSNSGGGAPNNSNDKPADLSKMNPSELAKHLAEVKANANTDQ